MARAKVPYPPPRREARPATAKVGERRAELQRAAQTSTTAGILFHQAVADRVGVHVTDLRCLNLLAQAGQLGQQLGLGMATAWTELLALFLDLFDRMHQLSQQLPASLPQHTPSDA